MSSIVLPIVSRPRDGFGLLTPAGSVKFAAMADALSVADGGFSVDPVTGSDIACGYAVSVHPDCERIILGTVTSDDLRAYLADVADTAALPGRVLGGWRDPASGSAFLDVSIGVDTLTDALQLARRHDQRAVFDFAALASIPVPAVSAA